MGIRNRSTTSKPITMSRFALMLLLVAVLATCYAQEKTDAAAEKAPNTEAGELEGRGFLGGYGLGYGYGFRRPFYGYGRGYGGYGLYGYGRQRATQHRRRLTRPPT